MNFTENKLKKQINNKLSNMFIIDVVKAVNTFANRIKWGNDVATYHKSDKSLLWIDPFFFNRDENDTLYFTDGIHKLVIQLVHDMDLETLQDFYDSLNN